MYSIPNSISANIGQSYEKNERLKEERNTVEYERKTGRLGLCKWYLSVRPETLRYGWKAKEIRGGNRISRFTYKHIEDGVI